jgi:hypothetical protein
MYARFKYAFIFNLLSIALKKMFENCFTHSHYIASLTPPWEHTLYPGIMKFRIVVEAILLYITMQLVFLTDLVI